MALGGSGFVGLDIGTSAVRAAQVAGGRGGASLISFGQVPLPVGAVADGEIQDPGPVSEAIAQLWKRVKIRSKKAVVGIANQRVVVRQVELPFQEEKEFRESIRCQVADFIPMSVDAAEIDFQILEDYVIEEGNHMMRVLLVAAATDMVERFIATTAAGGIEPIGVDLAAFAAARAVSPSARGDSGTAGSEAVVDVGAGVTNILVHDNGEPRFVRILLTGGDHATSALAKELSVSPEEAEAVKLDLGRDVGTDKGKQILTGKVDELVEEIRSSLEYYLSQADSQPFNSVMLTGGGSLAPGIEEGLEQAMHVRIERGAPVAGMNISKSGLTEEQVAQVEPVAAVAVGLAMGATRK
jgi:type IV pilus assembly protein PilM